MAEIFLIAEPEIDVERLEATLARVPAAALLLKAGEEDDFAYTDRAKSDWQAWLAPQAAIA